MNEYDVTYLDDDGDEGIIKKVKASTPEEAKEKALSLLIKTGMKNPQVIGVTLS